MSKKSKRALTPQQIAKLEANRRETYNKRERARLAQRLWGPVGSPERLDEEFARLNQLVATLTGQRDDALRQLNDRENLEMYMQRFDAAVGVIKKTSEACVSVGKTLRAQARRIG